MWDIQATTILPLNSTNNCQSSIHHGSDWIKYTILREREKERTGEILHNCFNYQLYTYLYIGEMTATFRLLPFEILKYNKGSSINQEIHYKTLWVEVWESRLELWDGSWTSSRNVAYE
jgi:hypothetical protein